MKTLLLALAVLPACTLVQIDADLAETCVNRTGIEVPAVTGTQTITHHYTVDDIGGLQDLVDLDADLRFVRFTARAESGTADALGAVDSAHVTIASGDPDSTLPTLLAYDCAGDCPVVGPELEVPAATDRGAADYVATGSLAVDVDVTGRLPDHAWTMDVSVCVSGHLAYSLDP